MPTDRLIVFDLEATCWEPDIPERVEILEIGAVRFEFAAGSCPAAAAFSEVVRPVGTPALSDFCLGLLPIGQAEADAADPFPAVFGRFVKWIGPGSFWLASWGKLDRALLPLECSRHGLRLPAEFRGYIDMRREFSRMKRVRPPSLRVAMESCGLEMEGTAHRALDDARNLARLTRILLDDHMY